MVELTLGRKVAGAVNDASGELGVCGVSVLGQIDRELWRMEILTETREKVSPYPDPLFQISG